MRRSDSPGNASEVRRINLMFWVTPHENELIRRRMAQAGTANLSAYLRKMAIDGLIIHLELPELKEMISLLRRCAGSLNQMAKRMNETGRVYEVDLREAMELQERLWMMANALLTRLAGVREGRSGGLSACRKSPPAAAFSARSLRNVCAQGRKLPARPAPEGSVSPVGCCAKRKATRRCAGRKRVPCGHLGRRPKATRSGAAKP